MKTQKKNAAKDLDVLDFHQEKDALSLVLDLMKIPGPSGEEAAAAEYVRSSLLDAGADEKLIRTDTAHRRALLKGDTGNLILKLPGTYRAPRRMLTAHLDTVPICVGSEPVVHNQMIRSGHPERGIGADDRAGVAVTLNAARQILKHNLPHPPLTFCWFVQEEIGLHGARCVSKGMLGNPKLAFNWDGGTPNKLTIGATGGFRMQINVRGIASHAGGAPEWGVSAISIASLAIADLQQNGWHGAIEKNGKVGTSNVGLFQGGKATNVVTDQVEIRAEARSHDPKFRARIVKEIHKAFEKAVKSVKNVAGAVGSVEIEERLDYESFRLKKNEACVRAATKAIASIGLETDTAIANGGVDANWLTLHGFPTVTLGCGQLNQHMVSEALDIEQYQTACRLGLVLATGTEESTR